MRLLRRRTRKALRNEYEDVAHGFVLGVPVIAGIIVVVLVLIAGGIWLATVSSRTRGNAAVTRQHNSGQNQVAQNTTLLNDSAVVVSDEQKLKVQAANVVTEQDRVDLAGLEQNCASDVQAYNAAVLSILATGYLPTGLPSSYPASVCNTPSANPTS
jgi:hypothetical protein